MSISHKLLVCNKGNLRAPEVGCVFYKDSDTCFILNKLHCVKSYEYIIKGDYSIVASTLYLAYCGQRKFDMLSQPEKNGVR